MACGGLAINDGPRPADNAAGESGSAFGLGRRLTAQPAAFVGVAGGAERLHAVVNRKGRAGYPGGNLQRLSRRSKPRRRSGVPRASIRSFL